MNLKDRKVKSKLWIHSKRPDNPAIKRRKTNPTGTRTATRQISPGNPSQKTQEENGTERPVREKKIIYYHHRNEWKKETRMKSTHEWSNQPVKNKRTHHTQCPLTHATHTHTHTHTPTHTHTHAHTHTHTHTHPRRHKLIRRTSTRARHGRLRTHLHVRQSPIRVGHHCGKRTRTRNSIRGPQSNLPSRCPQTNPPSEKTGAR